MQKNSVANYKKYHYTELGSDMLDYLHKTTLEMLKIIIPVFEKEGIRYSICGGTLRGAYLTGEFLPWDEDIDLCVYEEDYDRMTDLLIESVPEWIHVQCKKTEPNYFHGWIKIVDKNSHMYPDEPLYKYNGVLIDIYKLTKCKENRIDVEIAKEHLAYLNRRYAVGGISKEEKEKRIIKNNLAERIEGAKDFQNENAEKYIVWSTKKIIIDIDKCFPSKSIMFEGVSVACFKTPEHYLLRHYGVNYKEFPSEDERMIVVNRIDY